MATRPITSILRKQIATKNTSRQRDQVMSCLPQKQKPLNVSSNQKDSIEQDEDDDDNGNDGIFRSQEAMHPFEDLKGNQS